MSLLPLAYRHKKTMMLGLVCAVLIAGAAYAQTSRQEPLAYIPVARENVRTTLSKAGMIISESDTPLRFSSSDTVERVLVHEGQHVTQGQQLATMQSDSLAGSVMTAKATLETAQSRLQALKGGARPEEIGVLQAQMNSKKTQIDRLQQQLSGIGSDADGTDPGTANVKAAQDAAARLTSAVAAANSLVSSQYLRAKTALAAMGGVLDRLDVQDAIVKNSSADAALLHAQQAALLQDIGQRANGDAPATDADAVLADLRATRDAVASVEQLMESTESVLSQLQPTEYFTYANRDAVTGTLMAQQSVLQESLSRLDDGMDTIRKAQADTGTDATVSVHTQANPEKEKEEIQAQIIALQSDQDVLSAQLALKKAPPLKTDLDQAVARVKEAQGNLNRIMAEYKNTVLTAPMDGTVLTVNITVGQAPPLSDPAIILRDGGPNSVLVNLSDTDIAAVTGSATGSIAFDAMPGKSFPLRVDELSPSATKIDGIGNYQKLPLRDSHPELTDGMSGTVTIVLEQHRDALAVPAALLQTDAEGRWTVRVRRGGKDMVVPVETGLQGDGGMMEVTSGLLDGDVLVTPASFLIDHP